VGWRLREERLDLRVTLFAEEGRDTIDWVRAAPGERWTAVNLDTLETRGVALAASGEVSERVALTLDYLGLEKRCDSDPFASRYALDYARHALHAGLLMRLSEHCLLDVRQGFARQRANAAREGSATQLDSAVRLAVEVPGKGLGFELGVDNLLDRDYQIFPGQPPAGRRWVLVATVKW
jgi:outer membrane receptor protein involved in Fe transport